LEFDNDLLPESLFEKALNQLDDNLSKNEIIELVDFFNKVYYKDLDIKNELKTFLDRFI